MRIGWFPFSYNTLHQFNLFGTEDIPIKTVLFVQTLLLFLAVHFSSDLIDREWKTKPIGR